jgi:undecaprenyl-diphosphatase
MPTTVQAALLGIIQGVTEFLPISSTAHLLVSERLLGYQDPGGVFTVMIQLGSIIAVMWLYREKIVSVVTGLPSRPDARRFALMILLATVPALVAGALFSSFVKRVLYGSVTVIAVAFIAGGIVMLLAERLRPTPDVHDVDGLPTGRALSIGAWQALALIPGVSRSGGTIVAGMLMRVDRAAAAEFTFFLAMPTMAAAFAHDLWGARHDLGSARGMEIAIGFVMAFLASALVVKPFLNHVRRSGFAPFAWYRIVAGLALLAALAAGRLRCSGYAGASSPVSSSRCRSLSASLPSSVSSASSSV